MNARQRREPEVIVIWTPGDGNMHMVGCHHNGGNWKYSKPIVMPVSNLDGFIAWRMGQGMTCLDVRLAANLKTPGMGKATPVLLMQAGVDPAIAIRGYSRLHQAIIED